MDGDTNPRRTRSKRSVWKSIPAVAMALLIAFACVLALLYSLDTTFRERHVSYEYTVIIKPDASGQFTLVCSLPANHDGMAYTNALSSMTVDGDVTISKVTTTHGDGLEVVGTGPANITWSHSYTYRTSTQNIYDHYSNLTMLDIGYARGNAYVYIAGLGAHFSLSYHYDHMYGSVGANFLSYEVTGDLIAGWNTLPVHYDQMVA